jgi:hypothetical protein
MADANNSKVLVIGFLYRFFVQLFLYITLNLNTQILTESISKLCIKNNEIYKNNDLFFNIKIIYINYVNINKTKNLKNIYNLAIYFKFII